MRLENLELENRTEAQAELHELANLFRAEGLTVEVADPEGSFRARLEESAGTTAVDVINIIFDVGKDVGIGVVSAILYDWARNRKYFRGSESTDRPQARLWVVEDGRERDIVIDLDEDAPE